MANLKNTFYSAQKTSHKIGNITFWNLHFYPNELTEFDYWELKDQLVRNPNQQVFPTNDFWIFYRQEIVLFGTCIILLLLRKVVDAKWFSGITLILCLFGAYVLFLFIADVKEYFEYAGRRDAYLQRLKEDILNSFDYKQFVKKQNERIPYLYK